MSEPIRVKIPSPLAVVLDEASALTDPELEEYEEWLPEIFPNEFVVAKPSADFMRLFALAWHKGKKATEKIKESRALAKAGKTRISLERLADGLRFSGEHKLLMDVAINVLTIDFNLWRYGSLDSLWIRKGGLVVTSLIDSSVVHADSLPPHQGGGNGEDDGPDDDMGDPSADDEDDTDQHAEPKKETVH